MAMADSLIPGIIDHVVEDEIIPLLPWHTRPLLRVLNKAWGKSLDATGVPLDENGKRIARVTRLRQPLKCRLAIEYFETRLGYRRFNQRVPYGDHVVKLFDEEWRNVAPVTGRGPYICTSPFHIRVLGVVDGRLYLGQGIEDRHDISRIIVLDIGGGLWQWQEVCDINPPISYDIPTHICSSRGVAGGLYVYRRHGFSGDIIEIPACEYLSRVSYPPFIDINSSPQPNFVELCKKLYFFGPATSKQGVRFFDLNTRTWNHSRTWNDSMVETHSGDSLNVEKNVLLVAYDYGYFHILRYESSNARWIKAARMLSPLRFPSSWTWCVEYDEHGEKQLWIYIFFHPSPENILFRPPGGNYLNLCKWQVVERLREGRMTGNVWDDIVLPGGEVECQLVNRTPLDRSSQLFATRTTYNSRIHGFHRSDATNFEDIPRVNVPV